MLKPLICRAIRSDQDGSVMPFLAFCLPVFIGFCAISLDIAHLFIVRAELQNASDAAALAAVNSLYKPGTTPDVDYDWQSAKAKGSKVVKLNYADGRLLINGDVVAGYWNTDNNTFRELPYKPVAADLPAMKVTIAKRSGSNGGLVTLNFGAAINLKAPPVAGSAIAVMASPSSVAKGGMLPIVVSSCILNGSWDFSTMPPAPKLDQQGNPITWSFGPGMSGASACGDQSLFTAFDDKLMADADGVENLMSTGNLRPMTLGDKTYILDQSDDVSARVLPIINACSAAGDSSCEYVTVPIVNKTDGPAGDQKIVAFACLHILSAEWGDNSRITAQLGTLCHNKTTSGLGPPGTIYKTSLVQ